MVTGAGRSAHGAGGGDLDPQRLEQVVDLEVLLHLGEEVGVGLHQPLLLEVLADPGRDLLLRLLDLALFAS